MTLTWTSENSEPRTLSLLLEPLVEGVFVELPPSIEARPYDSDRVSVQPSSGREKHYVHLSPDETINFSREGLKVAIMAAEVANSSPQSSPEAIMNNDSTTNDRSEVQVKSSNVEPDAESVGDEDDETDGSDDNDLDATVYSAKTSAGLEVTPATVMETPHDGTNAKDKKYQQQHDNEDDQLYSTALDKQIDDTTTGMPSTGSNASPSVQAQAKRAAKELPQPKTDLARNLAEGIPPSDSEDDFASSAPKSNKPAKTYGKQKPARGTSRDAARLQPNAMSSVKPEDDGLVGDIEDANEGSPPLVEGTSEGMTWAEATRETASRSMSRVPPKRRASEADEEDGSPVSKKRKIRTVDAVENEEQMNTEEEVDREDEEPDAQDEEVDDDAKDAKPDVEKEEAIVEPDDQVETEDEDTIEVISKPATKAKGGKATKSSRRQNQGIADGSDTEPVFFKSSGKSKTSAVGASSTRRARKNLRTVGKTPTSSAESSILIGKAPSVLLTTESALRKSAGKWLKEQGASVINDVQARRNNFLCVIKDDNLTTTAKVLRSLALGKLVVTEEWIRQSKKADHLLNPEDFVPTDLKDTITVDRRNLFQGKNIFFTNALAKAYGGGWDAIQALAKEAGASKVDKGDSGTFGGLKRSKDAVCFGREKDDVDVQRLAQTHKCTVYHKDLLTHSIVTGVFVLDNEDFKLAEGGSKK